MVLAKYRIEALKTLFQERVSIWIHECQAEIELVLLSVEHYTEDSDSTRGARTEIETLIYWNLDRTTQRAVHLKISL